MAEHTPGPWLVCIDDQSGIGRTHSTYICTADGWPEGQLARVNVQDGFGEREANARLIAAAPCAVKMAGEIKHSIEQARIAGNDWRRELALIENLVDAWLTKARGEA